MEKELKKLFINSGITSVIIFFYGLIIREKSIYIGMFLGACLSVMSLYLLYKDAEYIVYTKVNPMKKTILGYGKRYLLFGTFLGIMIYIDFQWFLAGALGLLVVKCNILLKMFSIHLKNIGSKLKN